MGSIHTKQEDRAKAPWYVSSARTRHFGMPVLQIVSEPTSEVLALVPYSDRGAKAHAESYADANCIAAAPALLAALERASDVIRDNLGEASTDDGWKTEEIRDTWLACQSALAKAEGRS